MIFELPEILIAERAGRAMALGVNSAVEIGVSSSMAGAAALAAARRISNAGYNLKIILTDASGASLDAFQVNLDIVKKMKLVMQYDHGEEDFPCVISGTDATATLGSENFVVAKFFVNPEHDKNWDGWVVERNPYLQKVSRKRTITAEQAREIDKKATEEYGIPSICLMENAGIGAAVAAERMSRSLSDLHEAVVLVGSGNNGGDALVVARGLIERRVPVKVILLSDTLSPDATVNLEILRQSPLAIFEGAHSARITLIEEAGLIVDGIFGTGLNTDIEGEYKDIIGAANRSAAKVLSLDIPSGICADTGVKRGCAIEADVTVTFVEGKVGMFLEDGKKCCGDIITADIGAPL